MSDFVQSLHEIFERFGRIEARRMFGGQGIFHDGRMFALVVRDTLYLKSDAQTAAAFDGLQLPAFQFERSGQTTTTSYRQAPADLFEDRDEAARWARLAWEAKLRAGQKTKKTDKKDKMTKKSKPAEARSPARKAAAR